MNPKIYGIPHNLIDIDILKKMSSDPKKSKYKLQLFTINIEQICNFFNKINRQNESNNQPKYNITVFNFNNTDKYQTFNYNSQLTEYYSNLPEGTVTKIQQQYYYYFIENIKFKQTKYYYSLLVIENPNVDSMTNDDDLKNYFYKIFNTEHCLNKCSNINKKINDILIINFEYLTQICNKEDKDKCYDRYIRLLNKIIPTLETSYKLICLSIDNLFLNKIIAEKINKSIFEFNYINESEYDYFIINNNINIVENINTTYTKITDQLSRKIVQIKSIPEESTKNELYRKEIYVKDENKIDNIKKGLQYFIYLNKQQKQSDIGCITYLWCERKGNTQEDPAELLRKMSDYIYKKKNFNLNLHEYIFLEKFNLNSDILLFKFNDDKYIKNFYIKETENLNIIIDIQNNNKYNDIYTFLDTLTNGQEETIENVNTFLMDNYFIEPESKINMLKYKNKLKKINKYVLDKNTNYVFINIKIFDNQMNKIDISNIDLNKLDNKTIKKINANEELIDTQIYLQGIVLHIGILKGGHYKALVKYENRWYEVNDNSITKINNISDYKLDNFSPYILLYNTTNTYREGNPFGMTNMGNTCYANSLIQLLLSIPELNKELTSITTDDINRIKGELQTCYLQTGGNIYDDKYKYKYLKYKHKYLELKKNKLL